MLDVTMLRKNLPEVVARLKTRNFDFPVDAFPPQFALQGHRHDEEEWGGCFRAARSGSCYSG